MSVTCANMVGDEVMAYSYRLARHVDGGRVTWISPTRHTFEITLPDGSKVYKFPEDDNPPREGYSVHDRTGAANGLKQTVIAAHANADRVTTIVEEELCDGP